MKKIFLLCMAISLVSCGGSDFSSSGTSPLSDASDVLVEDAATEDVSAPDVVDIPDAVTESSIEASMDTSVADVEPDNSECTPGELSCQGKTPVFCNGNGELQTKPECEYLCVNGICAGECNPGAVRCVSRDVESCDSTGTWQVTSVCPTDCQQNQCNTTWCCKEDNASCFCDIYQVCNSLTGELSSCSSVPSECCFHSNFYGHEKCACNPGADDCQATIDHMAQLGETDAYIVDSCPE